VGGLFGKKFPHTHIQTDTLHPDYLSRASQSVRGATKKTFLFTFTFNISKVMDLEKF